MSQRTEDALTDAQKQTDLTNAFLSIAYQDQVSRRTALKGLLGLAGAAVLFGLPRAAGAAEATQETLDALAEAQAEYDAVQAQLNEIASQFQALTVQQEQTLDKIEDVQLQIDDTQAEIDKKQEELEGKQGELSDRVASSYKNGGNDALALLFSSESFDELLSNIYYIDKINAADREAIKEINAIQAELEEKKGELEGQKADLEELRDQQTQQLASMQAKQDEVQEVLSGLSGEVQQLVAQRDAEIVAAAEAEARAAEEARRQAELAAQQGSSGGGGSSSGGGYIPQAGSGQDYNAASAAQRRIVDSCYATPSPGANYCAAWVSRVFQRAGYGYIGGNANDMYARYCTYSNKAQLQVGMIVAVSTYSKNYAGRIWGHVGIYIGDNRIMENIGRIATTNLDTWCNYYGDTVAPRWGWAMGINLAA